MSSTCVGCFFLNQLKIMFWCYRNLKLHHSPREIKQKIVIKKGKHKKDSKNQGVIQKITESAINRL